MVADITDYINPGTPPEIQGLFHRVLDLSNSAITKTTEELHVYVNASTGSDDNDGLTPTTAKATIQAGLALIPFHIAHNVALHLEGVFTVSSTLAIERYVNEDVKFLIDGGDEVTVIADNAGTPWAADISSSSSIGLSTLSWAVDAYAGYLVEILSGPAAGQTRMIQANTATTLTPVRNFSIDPGAGAQFRVVRPTTEIAGGGGVLLYTRNNGGGFLILQRVYYQSGSFGAEGSGGTTWNMVISDSNAFESSWINNCGLFSTAFFSDPDTFATLLSSTAPYGGMSARGSGFFGTYLRACTEVILNGSYLTNSLWWKTQMINFRSGSRCRAALIEGCPLNTFASPFPTAIRSNSGYAATTFGPSTSSFGGNRPCIYVQKSDVSIGNGVDIRDSLSNGIELAQSLLLLDAAVTSSANANFGIFAHSNSSIWLNSSLTPTVSGTNGDLSIDDTTQVSTWAAIIGGTPVANATEMVVAKNYRPAF